ncbi:MAG TPA: glycosyltransferase [Methylovirgula sp.]|nr:glycosyltransferase [Methylovirgula sp.]
MPESLMQVPHSLGLHSLNDYEPLIGRETIDRIVKKAAILSGAHVVHISSTFYGGGVTEILTPLTLLMNTVGIETGWRMIQGTPEFFQCTKKIHNGLQGEALVLSPEDKACYEQVAYENAIRLHLEDCDAVIVHDPQPLPIIRRFRGRAAPWIWQCHVDLSRPHPPVWDYVRGFVADYDAAIFSLPEYRQNLPIDQHFMTPAIDPFSAKNCELSDDVIAQSLALHRIPTDLPIVTQISRFDRWKDPLGVIESVRRARQHVDCTLVLLGNAALDDPESNIILETIQSSVDERIIVLAVEDPQLVNALQRRASVVLQKSLREGFGLTVTEAMWKGAAVIGGNVGGIRHQIADGENGFLVNSVEEAADRTVALLNNPQLGKSLGVQARETVRQRYLLTHLLEQWIDLLTNVLARSERN